MTRDETTPDGRWEFDEYVADVFDDMLARSIPQYEVMRSAVHGIAVARHKPNGRILDLGTSRGAALRDLIYTLGAHARYVGIDVSEPMLDAARTELAAWIDLGYAAIDFHDLRTGLPPGEWQTVLSVLTLQFTPIEYRPHILDAIYRQLSPGGTLILVEKVLGANAEIDRLMVDRYLASKSSAGYTPEQIARKRLALEGTLVPVTARMNEQFLADAGFIRVDCFWRWMNFAGWVAIR